LGLQCQEKALKREADILSRHQDIFNIGVFKAVKNLKILRLAINGKLEGICGNLSRM
jgi:hypothetical protein